MSPLIPLLLALAPGSVGGQEPPDSIRPDSLMVDSLEVDSLGVDTLTADSLTQVADTLADSLRVVNIPMPATMGAPSPGAGLWEWDRAALLRIRGTTLEDLVATLPGVTALRAGDYGLPRTVAVFGFAAGAVKIRVDGIEWEPLVGTVPDLSQISLAGLNRVRVRRTGTGLMVDLSTLRFEDPDPISVIEVGTGDLDTNVFGAMFALPDALGGSAAVALDRIDTQGRVREEPSSRFGAWARYSWVPRADFGIEVDYRIRSVDRGMVYLPEDLKRSRWTVQGRWQPDERVVTSAFYSRTSQSTEPADTAVSGPGVSQYGVGLHASEGFVDGGATIRFFDGEGQLDRSAEAEVTVDYPSVGGASAQWLGAWWSGGSASQVSVQGWTAPFAGLSAFAGIDRGSAPLRRPPLFTGASMAFDVQIPLAPPEDSVEVEEQITKAQRDALRVGGRFGWRGIELGGAWLRVESDSAFATGLPMDAGMPALARGEARTGIEAWVRLPVPILDGLALEGWAVRWDSIAGPDAYRPRLSYDARVAFHNVFLPTENLELFVDVGAEGRDPMEVLVPEDLLADPPDLVTTVPFYQSWYARLQIRIVSLHIFAKWENFTIRDNNQDFPDRLLPRTRATYGVRWTLRN